MANHIDESHRATVFHRVAGGRYSCAAGLVGLQARHLVGTGGHGVAAVVRGAIGANQTILTPPQAYRNTRITSPR